jgi:hypothetical protein
VVAGVLAPAIRVRQQPLPRQAQPHRHLQGIDDQAALQVSGDGNHRATGDTNYVGRRGRRWAEGVEIRQRVLLLRFMSPNFVGIGVLRHVSGSGRPESMTFRPPATAKSSRASLRQPG